MSAPAIDRLPTLQAETRAAHDAAVSAAHLAIDMARAAGLRLIEAKGLLGHGQWLPWLTDIGITPRTAQRYMRLALLPADKYDTESHLTPTRALAAITRKRPDEPQDDGGFAFLLARFRNAIDEAEADFARFRIYLEDAEAEAIQHNLDEARVAADHIERIVKEAEATIGAEKAMRLWAVVAEAARELQGVISEYRERLYAVGPVILAPLAPS
jgi:hypothetical protein